MPALGVALALAVATAAPPTLFQSDMAAMAGTTWDAPHAMGPGWSGMAMGLARLQWNRQGGRSGADAVESFGASLREAYGDLPISTHAFLRVRWGRPHTAASAHHHP